MNRLALAAIAVFSAGSLTAAARTVNVEMNNVEYSFPASSVGDMNFDSTESITIGSRKFSLAELSRIYFDDSEVTDNLVTVSYSGETAKVRIAGNIAGFVDASVSGAHVSITQSSEVSESTCGEITYSLAGESADGSFYMTGDYKSTLELRGLILTNPSGAAIDIQNGKRIEFSVKSGTINTLTDGVGGSQKGCIVCKGHLELKGKGILNVTGNKGHAVYAKEYVEMKNLTLNITGAIKDGLNCNQYFLMESGNLNISNVGDDGLQTSFKDDVDREPEDTATITIKGGSVNIHVSANAAKGLKADGDIIVAGGNIDVTVTGNGIWDKNSNKTKASACLGCDGNVEIDGGTLNLKATGAGGKGINADGTLKINEGNIEVTTTGGIYAYINGMEYLDYTGNTDRINSDYRSSAKGMKIDGDVVISGGEIKISTSGRGSEGIESKKELTITGGEILVLAYDDAINSSSHMYIDGGSIVVISTNNDGLDSNGNLYIRGGHTLAFGGRTPECGIDANEEEGYSVVFTGGELLAVGGGNSVPRNSSSTQPYITTNDQVTANTSVVLKSGDKVLAEFTIPEKYNPQGGGRAYAPGGSWGPGFGAGFLITCPEMVKNQSYTLINNSTTSSVTAK